MSTPALPNNSGLPACNSAIWGSGKVIDTIMRSRLFKDSKTFVDMKLKKSEDEILKAFNKLPEHPSKEDLHAFVAENFDADTELAFEMWDPEDWTENPRFISKLSQKPLIHVCHEVNKLWKLLSQRCSKDLHQNPDRYSKVDLPHGFIMPGGRFREIYYWDTYWILRGLLISEMFQTAKGVLLNFVHQIQTFGHIPNGTRVYYISRSQIPFFPSMVYKYVTLSGDKNFLNTCIDSLEKEIDFFEQHRSFKYNYNGKDYTVFRYCADSSGPRPESYWEDVELADEHYKTDAEKEELYLHIKAAAESGWDFSSRWLIDEKGGHSGTLANAKTCYIIPADLNSLMYRNYVLMGLFSKMTGRDNKVAGYRAKAQDMLRTVSELLWDPQENMWFDFDTLNHRRRTSFYASNLFPLWAEAYPQEASDAIAKCAVNYLMRTGVTENKGGVPASLLHSGQQWDFNAWPPLQHLIVSGLNKTGNAEAMKLAFKIAKNYTLSTIVSCNVTRSCELFEKYDPTHPGEAGHGGEYEVQTGFGWTNGVLVDFINTYGDELIQTEADDYKPNVGGKASEKRTPH